MDDHVSNFTDAQLAAAAQRIRLSPEEIEAAFDGAMAERDTSRLPFMVEHAIAPIGMEPVEVALEAARRGNFVEAFIVRAANLGGMGPPAAGAPSMGSTFVALQAVVDPALGFADAATANQALTLATVRICQLLVQTDEGDVRGTGFLVGPQAVITSFHVVGALVDEGRPRPGSEARIGVEFDRLTPGAPGVVVPVAADWLIGGSAPHPTEMPGQSALTFTGDGDLDFDTHLDFALIRLAAPIGRERGYYRLDPERWPSCGQRARVTLLQRPNAGLKMSFGLAAALWPDRFRSRLKHTANSTAGSSGGLLLDADYQPIGLHQCGVACGTELVNGAIPTARIASTAVTFDTVVGTDPLWRLQDGSPVIGRRGFQDMVMRAVSGPTRIVSVNGGPKSGRSFSFRILGSLLDDGSHRLVELPASDVPDGAWALAVCLLERLHPSPAEAKAQLPDPADAQTAEEAWIRDALFPALIQSFREAAPNRTIWLLIDDLDRNSLANTSARHLLERLYADIGRLPFLRVVLVGVTGLVPAADRNLVEYDDIRPTTDLEIDEQLRLTFVATDRAQRVSEAAGLRLAIRQMMQISGASGIGTLATLVGSSLREVAA